MSHNLITNPISDIKLLPIFITVIRSPVINIKLYFRSLGRCEEGKWLGEMTWTGFKLLFFKTRLSPSNADPAWTLPTEHERTTSLHWSHCLNILSPFLNSSPYFHPNPSSKSQRPGEGMVRAELIALGSFFSYNPVGEAKPPQVLEF